MRDPLVAHVIMSEQLLSASVAALLGLRRCCGRSCGACVAGLSPAL